MKNLSHVNIWYVDSDELEDDHIISIYMLIVITGGEVILLLLLLLLLFIVWRVDAAGAKMRKR